jgi:diaminopimelate decarboxylase
MSLLRDSSGVLELGRVPLCRIAAEAGTPAYVYDLDDVADRARRLEAAFEGAPHLVAYAVKANAAGPVVRTLAALGCGADVVSGAELLVALACGVPPERIVYSGVAKRDAEIDRALGCGERGIGAVQIESVEEIARVEARARAVGRTARVGLRINPSVDLEHATHSHIATGHDAAKFGVPLADVGRAVALAEASPHLELVGMGYHAGSQFTEVTPYVASARVLFELVRGLRDQGAFRSLRWLDTGGGFGVDYGAGIEASPADFLQAVRREQNAWRLGDLAHTVEPGRWLVAPSGVLLASVIQVKVASAARWLMIDAGMNDLIRPALYQGRHRVVPLEADANADVRRPDRREGADANTDVPKDEAIPWRVVGPVCESSDDFGEHLLPRVPPAAVAILDAGAYGYTMASRYNGRQLPVEVFLRGGRIAGATARASVESWAEERAQAGGRADPAQG